MTDGRPTGLSAVFRVYNSLSNPVRVTLQQLPLVCSIEPSLNWVLSRQEIEAIHADVRDSIGSAAAAVSPTQRKSVVKTITVSSDTTVDKWLKYSPEPKMPSENPASGSVIKSGPQTPVPMSPQVPHLQPGIPSQIDESHTTKEVTAVFESQGKFKKLTRSQQASLEAKLLLASKLSHMPLPIATER